MAFNGFPPETSKFLAELSRNNTRAWFEKHKPRYKEFVDSPAKEFCTTMEEKLSNLVRRPLTGKVFRIYRDVRFGKDKTPYNTHIRLLFHDSEIDSKCGNRPVLCFSLEKESVITGAGTGTMEFSGPTLEAFREAIVADTSGKALEKLVKKFDKSDGFRVDPPSLKKVPRGFDADHPRANLLRHKALMVWHDQPLSADIHSATCATHLTKTFRQLKPVVDWIDTNVDGDR